MAGERIPRRRRVERWVLGGAMTVVAFVLERRMVKAMRKKDVEEEELPPPADQVRQQPERERPPD